MEITNDEINWYYESKNNRLICKAGTSKGRFKLDKLLAITTLRDNKDKQIEVKEASRKTVQYLDTSAVFISVLVKGVGASSF